MPNAVTCPACRHEFEVTQVLAAQLSEQIRAELQQEVAKRQQAMDVEAKQLKEQQAALEASEASLEQQVADRLKEERTSLLQQARQKAEEALAVQLQDQESEVSDLKKRLKDAQAAELSLRQRERDLTIQAEQQELEVARQLGEERSKIREETLEEADQQHRLNVAEKEKLILQMQQRIDELKRKSEQGSQQMQGEVLELDIERTLEDAFPDDCLLPVPKGINGGDTVQHVRTTIGRECGAILWESKRTRNWSKAWLPKLRDDQRQAGAECAVIVSEALPENVKTFAHIDGIWVCSRQFAVPLAMALRAGIIEVAKARTAAEGRHDKADYVYNYLCSADFTHHLSGMVEAYSEMTNDLDKEERSAKSRFRKRRKQLERAFTSTSRLYGDIQGLIGNAMPEITRLELDSDTDAA